MKAYVLNFLLCLWASYIRGFCYVLSVTVKKN
jgi:hypothetical protein